MTPKLQKNPSALKREHPARENMKILYFFYFCGSFLPSWIRVRIRTLNADPDPATQINADPDPDPQPCNTIKALVGDPDPQNDPHVFGPPGSESVSQIYVSGSGSFPFLIKWLSGLQ